MRILLTTFAALATSLATTHAVSAINEAPRTDRPNILLLYADDWRHDTLAVAGHPTVKTPRLDALASTGVRFTHNCVTTSICSVSRATLLTGQWMSRHGCRNFGPFKTPWKSTVAARLRESGYFVGYVGKWHNGKFPAGEYDQSSMYHGKHWYEVGGERTHVTARNEADALAFLQSRPQDQPFFLTVAFFAPHAEDANPRQYLPQAWSAAAYEEASITQPPNNTLESWHRLPPFFTEENEGRKRWRARFDTDAKYREMMTNYYRLVTEVDRACGVILDKLIEQDQRNNTLVIFTSDNGYYHGEHGLADKWYPHQESIRVPLIIDDPCLADTDRGSINDRITLNADLAPTILSAAGVTPPLSMQGRDIAPLYKGRNREDWREDFYYEHPTLRRASFIPASEALVSKDWKYLYWPETRTEQLFDLTTDPREENDLASLPEHQDQLERLRERFAGLKAEAR